MDDELLRVIYHYLKRQEPFWRPSGCSFNDAGILFVYFLSVIRSRSLSAVYPRREWPLWARRLELPSYSQVNRRLKGQRIRQRIDQINAWVVNQLPASTQMFCDGKPLTVGHFSKDPDAKTGALAQGKFARGYKAHAVVDEYGVIRGLEVTPLNLAEGKVMQKVVAELNLDGCTIRADANYDSNRLYGAVADRGGRLVAPRRKPGRGLGHHPQHPHRLQAIDELEGCEKRSRGHKRHRIRIEQAFAHLTNLPFGLAPLPNAVRRLHRVRRYVKAKIVLYHVYLLQRQRNRNRLAA